eukprot:s616_g19.t3
MVDFNPQQLGSRVSGSSQLFVELIHMFEEAIHQRSRYYQVPKHQGDGFSLTVDLVVADYLEVLAQMHRLDEDLRRAELYVCTAPCSLLRAVEEKPLLAYLGMQLHVHVDRQIDQLWLMHFQAMVRRWASRMAHLESCDLPLQLRLVKDPQDFVTFGEMRHFRAAVLFPWDPTLMAFYELYRLNTVLLLPRSGWIFKVQHFTGWIWSQPLGALEFAHVAQQRHTTGAGHLQRFGSFAELFQLLLDTATLRQARRGMQRPGGNPSMLGHACRSPPCSRDPKSCKGNGNCCADLMFEMLVDFSNFLRRNNVTFMVSEGTLLGAVRDQDIIPYTADLDIFVPREGWEKAMLINEEPPSSKSYHFMVDPDQPHCARLCAVWQGYPANRAPFDEHFEWDTEKVGNDLAYYMDIYDEDMDFAQATKHLIYPPSMVMIRNVSFPAPREQEIYVEARYGPSWRVPDHQARELAEKYPTLEEAKVWSTNMLLLQAAQKDATIGFRLLERASVDYRSGDIVIRGLSQGHPQQTAKKLVLEEFQMTEDRKVKGGKVTVYPPEHDETQILDYVLYWAREDYSSWSEEIIIKRIDSGMDSLEDAPARKEPDEGNEWYKPEPEPRPLGRIWRCKGVEDPFKSCSTRGVPLQVSIPHDIQVPSDATHLAVAAENEVGESQKLTAVNLNGEDEGDGFSARVFYGILRGFEVQSCATGGHQLEKEGWEQIVALMVLRTNSGMKDSLTKLAEWLAPVSEILEDCHAETAKRRFSGALSRLKSGEMTYKPGEALELDQISIFSHVNSAIQIYRNTHQSFTNFGTELGTVLLRLAPEVSTSEVEPDVSSSSRSSGLKLRGMTGMTGVTAEYCAIMAIGRISNWASDLFFPVEGREGSRPGSQERRSHETLAARISQAGRQVLEADRSNEGWTFVAPSPAPLLLMAHPTPPGPFRSTADQRRRVAMPQPGRPKFDRVSAPEVEHGLVRPLRYVENRGSAQRVADAFRNGKVVLLEHEFDPKPWKSQMFSAMTDATSFLVAARYYMKLDPQTKKDAWGWWEFFRPSACGLEAEVVELPGKECVHLSKEMVERLGECAARAAWRGFDCLARGLLLTLQAAEPSFEPDVYGDDQGHFTAGAGVYRDKLKPLLDSTDAGHLLSIFSYTGEGACIEHVDRGFITLVTNTDGALQVQDSQSRWLDVPQTNGLVAFAGKTLEFLTQGKYPAVPHRIAPGKATGRVSLAFKLRAPLAAELVLRNGDVTTVGQLFESHVDALGLSINQPSTAIASTATAGAVSSSVARGHQGHHGPRGGYGEAEAERGAKLANSAGAVTVVPLFQSCELPAFLACRAVCREWLGYSDMSQCWVRFCIQRGIPWLHRQLDWPGYFSDWQKKLYIWRHQPKIRAVAIQSPFAMYSNVRPRPPVCRSQRFSAAIRQWGMAGHCEVKFYRPDEGRKTECLGVWDGVLLRQSHLQENIDEVEFSRHGGTTWDPFLGELNLSDQILFHIVMRGD